MSSTFRNLKSTACVALGSNLGDRLCQIIRAATMLESDRAKIAAASSLYETEPIGGPPDQADFLNAVVELVTLLDPGELLQRCQDVETQLGRTRTIPNAPRTIDLDLLLYDDQIVSTPNLTVPHPRMHERVFVLLPLAEICPQRIHPTIGRPIQALLDDARRLKKGRIALSSSQWDLPDRLNARDRAHQ